MHPQPASVSFCPICQRDLLLPGGFDGGRRLGCPHCGREFRLADAAKTSVPLPPSAVILKDERSASELAAAEAGVDHATFLVASGFGAAFDNGPASPVAARADDAEPDSIVSPASEDLGAGELVGERPGGPRPEFEEPLDERSPVADFDATPSIRTSPASRRRSVGMVGQLLGIVLGGAFGLALGYAILLRIQGPVFDPLHLADKAPNWMLPPSARRPAPPEPTQPAERGRKGSENAREARNGTGRAPSSG